MAEAQAPEIGLRLGASRSWLTEAESQSPDTEPRHSIVGGLFAKVPLSGGLQIRPEVLYVSRGGRQKSEMYEAVTRLDYLEVPLFLVYYPRAFASESIAPFLSAGPSIAVQLDCSVEQTLSGSANEFDCDATPGPRSVTAGRSISDCVLELGPIGACLPVPCNSISAIPLGCDRSLTA